MRHNHSQSSGGLLSSLYDEVAVAAKEKVETIDAVLARSKLDGATRSEVVASFD